MLFIFFINTFILIDLCFILFLVPLHDIAAYMQRFANTCLNAKTVMMEDSEKKPKSDRHVRVITPLQERRMVRLLHVTRRIAKTKLRILRQYNK